LIDSGASAWGFLAGIRGQPYILPLGKNAYLRLLGSGSHRLDVRHHVLGLFEKPANTVHHRPHYYHFSKLQLTIRPADTAVRLPQLNAALTCFAVYNTKNIVNILPLQVAV